MQSREDQLLERARSDSAQFAPLYERYYDEVFRYCMHRLFDRPAAEDATGEVFLSVIRGLPNFRGGAMEFRRWLYRIASNAATDHIRKTARRRFLFWQNARRLVRHGAENNPSDDNERRLQSAKGAIAALRPREQTIITLRFFENMKITEIAAIVGKSPDTVRSQMSRAIAKLRRRLGLSDEGAARKVANHA